MYVCVCISKRNENTYPHINLSTNVSESGNIPNVHQLITDKQNVVYPYEGILFSHEKEVLIHATTWMNLEKIIPSERKQSQ